MGTNYYIGKYCEHCGHMEEILHIGKSSAGWCFALHVTSNLLSLDDWLKKLQSLNENEKIYDEYKRCISLDELLSIITERKNKPFEKVPYLYKSWDDFHQKNHSEFGPNGLIRSKIDGLHCIGHGSGTWDLITGIFS